MSLLEALAVIVSLLGVWLTTARSLWNYPFSLISVAMYVVIFYRERLYADAALQVIFAVTLLYGIWQWTRGRNASGDLLVTRIHSNQLALSVVAGLILGFALGFLLRRYTNASLPWIDSLLFAMSLVASVWAARRTIESWWMWIVIDGVYLGVYVVKHLNLTAALYALFVALAFLGLRQWKAALITQSSAASAGPREVLL
jgi:nicotinamide mononucleotide transporter